MHELDEAIDALNEALPAIGQTSFPGMSEDEFGTFTLGYWAGAMTHALATLGTTAADEIAERVEAELQRIILEDDEDDEAG